MLERIQKIIAGAGVASRRHAEEFITTGRVRVNGVIVKELGSKADPRKDKIEIDGKKLVREKPVYIVMHKPRGMVATMRDPEGRSTIAELFRNLKTRVYPVGRLDYATSGVLLATNDGEFANALLHPKKSVPKTYVVKVNGLMSDNTLDSWKKGVELEDGMTKPAQVRLIRYEEDKTWFELTLREGRNQQIRRMGEATGFPVMRLARIRFAGIDHQDLKPGEWRYITSTELIKIQEEHGVPKRIPKSIPSGVNQDASQSSFRSASESDDKPNRRNDRNAQLESEYRKPNKKNDSQLTQTKSQRTKYPVGRFSKEDSAAPYSSQRDHREDQPTHKEKKTSRFDKSRSTGRSNRDPRKSKSADGSKSSPRFDRKTSSKRK